MKTKIIVLLSILLASMIAGCSSNIQYEGKWVAPVRSDWDGTIYLQRLDITKNGENYIINVSREEFKDTGKTVGEMGKNAQWTASAPEVLTATLKEGQLVINQFQKITLNKNDGTIIGTRQEVYKKETTDEVKTIKSAAKEIMQKKYPGRALNE